METIVIEETRIARVRNFLNRHSTILAVGATAALCVVAHRMDRNDAEEFDAADETSDELHVA